MHPADFETHCSNPRRTLFGSVRERLRAEQGVAIVEFALILTPLLLVVVGIVTFGRVMNYNEQATHLANEAARYAAVDYSPVAPTKLDSWALSQSDTPELKNGTGAVAGAPTFTFGLLPCSAGAGSVGCPVEACMSFKFRWVSFLGFATTTITRTAVMRLEAPYDGSAYTASTGACA